VDRNQTGLREMQFVFERDRYLAPDLTDAAQHLFSNDNKIVQLAYAAAPHSLVFARTDKRKLYCLTYRRENSILAWSPWTFSWQDDSTGYGGVEWVTTMKAWEGDDPELSGTSMGAHDNIFCVVNSPNSTRMIVAVGDPYVHDAQSYPTARTASTLSNMDQFADIEDIRVTVSGTDVGAFDADSSGDLTWTTLGYTGGTLPDLVNIACGLGINFELIPTVPYLPDRSGATQGRLQAIYSLRALLVGTKGLSVEGVAYQQGVPSTTAVGELNGWYELSSIGEHGDNNEISITQTLAYYCEIGGINFGVDYSG